MVVSKTKLSISIPLFALLLGSCGKGSQSDDPAKENEGTNSGGTTAGVETFRFSGQLAVATGLVASQRQILHFSILGGEVTTAPTVVAVDGEGNFKVDAPKTTAEVAAVRKALDQNPVDREALARVFSQYANEIRSMSEEEIKSKASEMLSKIDAAGGPQHILVSYIPGTSALEEAKSFQFVGLPTNGSNDVILFPGDSVKGDVALGKITAGNGDKASSELRADTNIFALDENSIAQLASLGQTLKVVKNYWVNKTGVSTQVGSRAEPFFMWKASFAQLQAGSQPTDFSYSGWGTYVSYVNKSLDFSKLCPVGSPYGTPTQIIQFVPPSNVVWGQMGNNGQISNPTTLGPTAPFNNGQTSQSQQNNKTVCNGSLTGFYARDDGDGRYMFNWGTGGSIQGVIPTDFWQLKLDNSIVGYFDLSAAFPLDAQNKVKVLVPSVTITQNAGKLTSLTVKWNVYNSATSSFEAVTDVSLFKKMSSEVAVSVSVGNGTGSDERRGVLGRESNDINVAWSGAEIKAEIPTQYQFPFGNWGEANKVADIMIQYKIGSSTYNFSFRN